MAERRIDSAPKILGVAPRLAITPTDTAERHAAVASAPPSMVLDAVCEGTSLEGLAFRRDIYPLSTLDGLTCERRREQGEVE
jgi:hypothetical protein